MAELSIDRQLTLLRMAARVDPNLRAAVEDVDTALATARTAILEIRKRAILSGDAFIFDVTTEALIRNGWTE